MTLPRRAEASLDPYEQLDRGRLVLGSTGKVDATATTDGRVSIENPGDSGKDVYIVTADVFVSAGPVFPTLHDNPSGGLPEKARTVENANYGAEYEPAARLKADASDTPVTGGSNGVQLGLGGGINNVTMIKRMPPGNVFGINFPFGASGGKSAMNVYWVETDH